MAVGDTRIWIIGPRGEAVPGFYRTKLVKGGPWVGVRFDVTPPAFGEDGEPLWDFAYSLTIDGKERDPFDGRVVSGEPITKAEFSYLERMREHAITHEPDMPEANPRQKVDFNTLHFNF